jgi:hypothetical protein
MKRDPRSEPQPGDVLSYKGGWTIRVTRRDPETVFYTTGKAGERGRESQQGIAEWQAWTPAAKVLERAGEPGECVVTALAAGPCSSCRKTIQGAAHIAGDGLFCEGCCPLSASHGKRKTKKRKAEKALQHGALAR